MNDHHDPAASNSWGCGKIAAIGCLGVVLLFLVAGIYVSLTWKGWVASAGRAGAVTLINETNLPAAQKQAMTVQIDRLADGFNDGKISAEQLGQVLVDIMEGPIMPAAFAYSIHPAYVEPSGLSAEEKMAAEVVTQRIARGFMEGKLDATYLDQLSTPIFKTNAQGEKELRESMTDDEIRALIEELAQKADDLNIPDEPYDVDFADELKSTIDGALGPAPANP